MSVFLPKVVLTSEVNFFYFVWAPFYASWHNLKVVYNQRRSEIEEKVNQKAEEILLHDDLLRHGALSAILAIPGINFVPFSLLVIKAKEHWVPKEKAPEVAAAAIPKRLEEKKEEEKKPVMKETTPSAPESMQQKNLVRRDSSSQKTLGARVQAAAKLFEQDKHPPLIEKEEERSPLVSPKAQVEKLKESNEFLNRLGVRYFVLFPEEEVDPQLSLLRQSQKEDIRCGHALKEELAIIDKLLYEIPYPHLKEKLENLEKNLDTLQKLLEQKYKNPKHHFFIRKTYSHDVQIKLKDNPYEIVRRSLFSSLSEKFQAVLDKFTFTLDRGAITIS